ncbi:hypothetical protein TNIN_287951 [Trichonephila inaurata madagascariensis]|uniref:Uncharacterized protein n=1 Tax=Trichonephila inaurata madagascariensis TaxID=2747483 RepID=A0A8X6Y9G9_9ARAC|nr:hypothetical protein TNIN_287951 [Trichonephila inaurata madagascariensis]
MKTTRYRLCPFEGIENFFSKNHHRKRDRGKSDHIKSKLHPNRTIPFLTFHLRYVFDFPRQKRSPPLLVNQQQSVKNPRGAPLGTSNHTKATAEKNPIKKGPAFEELDSLVVRRSGNISSTLKKTSPDQRKIVEVVGWGWGNRFFEQYGHP